jgi:hypothetical protein
MNLKSLPRYTLGSVVFVCFFALLAKFCFESYGDACTVGTSCSLYGIALAFVRAVGHFVEYHDRAIETLSTFFVACFTYTLWRATEKLGVMAVEQGNAMERSITESSRAADNMEAIATSVEVSATAASQSIAVLRETNTQQLRAFVCTAGIDQKWVVDEQTKTINWVFSVLWQNLGRTPSKKLRVHAHYELRDTPLPADFNFDYETPHVGKAFLPPGHINPGGGKFWISAGDLNAVRDGKKFFYVYGWAKYFDVFPDTPERITRFNYAVEVAGDAATPLVPNPIEGRPALDGVSLIYRLQNRNNCADDECEA